MVIKIPKSEREGIVKSVLIIFKTIEETFLFLDIRIAIITPKNVEIKREIVTK